MRKAGKILFTVRTIGIRKSAGPGFQACASILLSRLAPLFDFAHDFIKRFFTEKNFSFLSVVPIALGKLLQKTNSISDAQFLIQQMDCLLVNFY